ncbi:MAG: HlyD family efflux transporter periplasmic adaptor subunit [Gammaproteobacteria bacterium]|nr:HlyD family efflux transporter periplasmic adaptor subunit [Gammaproteobacteria bacterium]
MRKIIFGACLLLSLVGCSSNNHKQLQGYVEGKYTYLSSPLGGQLQQLLVTRGAQVKVGQLAYVLDPEPEASQLKQASDNLAQARQTLIDYTKGKRQEVIDGLVAQREQVVAQLVLDKKTLTRYQHLYKTGAIDKASVDTALSAYQRDVKKISEIDANLAEAKLGARDNQIKAQQATVEAAKADVTKAQWSLAQKRVSSSVTGQVFDTYYRVGEYVNAGQPVVSVLAPANIKLIFFVPEPVLGHVKVGQKISFTCDGCGQIYSATISYISAEAEYTPPVIYSRESRAKLVYRVEARTDNNTAIKLHVGQPIDVTL